MSEEVAEADISQASDADVVSSDATSAGEVSDNISSSEASSFDWEDWDGSVDQLPENHREIGGRFSSHYESQASKSKDELEGLRELYDAMMSGREDPRIAKFQSDQKSFDERYNGLQDKFDGYRSQVEKTQTEEAQTWADQFEERHKDLLSDTKQRERMVGFLDQGWDPDVALKLLSMDEEFVKMAEEAKSNGVPDSYAIRLAEVSAGNTKIEKQKKIAPRPGARITAGATGAKNPQQVVREIKDSDGLDDRRIYAARAALKAVQGGRR
tara:strand:+ start:4236 stop:5042 length:807 start_codon:yes stop_codon:yes gene_type:complete